MQNCLIYCRVSSERQTREGNGVSSQEQRCRQYAAAKGYKVVEVFKDEGVSGALFERPGIQSLLSFLKSHKGKEKTPVIVDDISRIARSVQIHIALRAAVIASGGVLESPSFKFEENAMGEMVETIFAAVAQYGRSGNREQVLNRQRARLEQGFWTFPSPPGYVYAKHPIYKKIATPDCTRSAIIKQALEGFATYRFSTQREVAEYLKEQKYFGEQIKKVHTSGYETAVKRILDNLLFYAGFIQYPQWGIGRVQGKHEPLISEATMYRIQERLAGKLLAPPRTDSTEDFVLRNYVLCPECERPLTASWAKNGQYPRYHCYNQKNCSLYGKSVNRDKLHSEFEKLLLSLKASEEITELIGIAAEEVWKERVKEWSKEQEGVERECFKLSEQVSSLVHRLGRVTDDEVAEEVEKQIKAVKAQRDVAKEMVRKYQETPADFNAAYAFVSTTLQNPYLTWAKGSIKQKRTVCRIAFTVPPAYSRETGFSTSSLSLPYLISQQYSTQNTALVEVAGVTPASKTAFVRVLHAQSQIVI